jgi:hypothetical protein
MGSSPPWRWPPRSHGRVARPAWASPAGCPDIGVVGNLLKPTLYEATSGELSTATDLDNSNGTCWTPRALRIGNSTQNTRNRFSSFG